MAFLGEKCASLSLELSDREFWWVLKLFFFKELISNLNEIRGWSQRVLYGIIIDKITRMKESRVPTVNYAGS